MERFARWLVRHPIVAVVANLAVTAILAVYALHVRIENSLESVMPSGDPEVEYYERVRRVFGSDDVAVVGVRADDIFVPATIEKIARVTNALGKIEGVEGVVSITNMVEVGTNIGTTPPRLLQRIPPTPDEIDAFKKKLATTPLYGKNLVADDWKGVAINVFFRELTDTRYADLAVDEKITAVLAAESGPERFFYTGSGHLKQAAVRLMRRDLAVFTPIALALMLLAFWFSFRTIRGVVLPMLSVGLALVWTLGIMVLAGKSITIGTVILPPLLLVVGSSYAIHVMARYYEQVWAGVPPESLVPRAFERVWLPLTISALVTVVGFGSLMVNRITAIWDLGLFAVVGVVCLTVTSLTFLPAMLQALPATLRTARSGQASPALERLLHRVGARAHRSRRPILCAAAALAVVAVLCARLIEVDSNFLTYFERDSPVRVDYETINREIVGSNTFYVVFEAKEPGMLRRWEVLKLVKDLQAFLGTLPGITSSMSLVDVLELLESGINRGADEYFLVDDRGNLVPPPPPKTFWEDPSRLETVLGGIDQSPSTFKGTVTADFSTSNILVRTNLSGSRQVEETLAAIRAYVAEHFPADLPVRLTGTLVLMNGTNTDIVRGQIESLGLALGMIFLVMALMFLSVKIGFMAILPNVLPITLFFGTMGVLGIQLNLGTSLIAAIALGIAVDSTIHYMARLNLELRGETEQREALVRTVATVGVPIVDTSVALAVGFLVFAFSSFVPIGNFGTLASMTMMASLGANLVLLPALLATTKIITLWDLLGVRLGADPARTIPLFRGLSAAQARIVVLMGELRRYGPGEPIVRQGDEGHEMFVIIRGMTEVWAARDGARRKIGEHHRGDVFGEMALVRSAQRTADVIASTPLEVLAVDERFLERIQRRYPRIACKVFVNLTRVLSDRLERMTEEYVSFRAKSA
jgi:predicted RND superfamily exporter protein